MKKTLKQIWRYLKYTIIVLLAAFSVFVALNWETSKYGYLQAKGQLKVIFGTVPNKDLLANSRVDPKVKNQIKLIQEIKKFAVDSLGLSPTNSYNRFFDQKGEPILWVITASPPYELAAKEWHFPILGTFKYKGYFEKKYIDENLTQLHKEGLETRVSEVSAWSTLGILNDPILSSMLDRDEGDLAALIIHEMTHGTVFVKNGLTFNENLADFIGDYGAKRFLSSRYGLRSKEYMAFISKNEAQSAFYQSLTFDLQKLKALYSTFSPEMESITKDSLKANTIKTIIQNAYFAAKKDTVLTDFSKFNNAYFVGLGTYQSKQKELEELFMTKCNGDFSVFLEYIKNEGDDLATRIK